VIDNEGYGTQRPMLIGENNTPLLRSVELSQAFGFGRGFLCKTEDKINAALTFAINANEWSDL
jgi:hypothetical protein